MVNEVKIPISAELDKRGTDQAVQQMVQQVNKIGDSIARANKLKFQPVDKAAIEDLRRMNAQFESMVKISGALKSRLSATGQAGRGFADIDWERIYPDPSQRSRSMRNAFDYVSAGTVFNGRFSAPVAPPPAPPGNGGGGGGGGGGGHAPGGGGGGFPGAGVVGAGLNAMGPAGRVANSALGAGISGGLLAGAGALVGGLAALGVGKAISAVMDKVGDAQQEGIGYDTLKRQLGDVNVSFEMLRGSIRAAAEALDTDFETAQRLGTEFTKLANVTADQAHTVQREIRIGGGLGRALGLDPSQGVGLLGQMRLSRVTSSETDSRRMALMIGEAVGRVGFAKADELMAAVTGYVSQQTRQGMTAANAGGYLGTLTGMAGSGRAGLDLGGAAALLGRVNSSIMGGGSAGEAGQNFMFATLGRQLGLSPIQTKILQQQGAFGTGAGTFGGGSIYADFAKKFGGRVPGRGAASGATNLQMIMGGLKSQYGGMGADYLAAATASLLGVNESQAMALMLHGEGGQLNGIEGRLKKAGIGLNQLSATGIGALGRINSGSLADLQAQAASLRGRTGADALSPDELKRLNTAMGGGDIEQMRNVLTELTATREQEKTEGSETRKSIEGVGRETQKLATVLVPVANTMRDALVAIAAKIAPDSAFGQASKQAAALKERDAGIAASDEELRKFDAETASIQTGDRYKSMPGGAQKNWMQAREKLREQMVMKRSRNFGSDSDYQSGADALMGSLINAESSGNHYGPNGELLTSGKGARGITQVMPKTGTDPGFGVAPLKDQSEAEYRRFGRDYLAAMLRRYKGDQSKSLAAYNWGVGNVDSAIGMYGDDWLKGAPQETQNYVQKVMAGQSASGAGGGGKLTVDATVPVKFVDEKTGKKIGTGNLNVKVEKPAAAGTTP